MKPLKRLNYILFIIVCMLFIGCSKKTIEYEPLPSGTTVLAFGDSVTYGYGVSAQQSYPSQLAAITGWNITNAGVSGETAFQAKKRIDSQLTQYKPALVLIELGGNDFLGRRSYVSVKEDLRQVIQSVKKADAIPVLIAVPALSPFAALGKPSDAAIYQELANEEQVVLIKSIFSTILGNSELHSDQIHPNASGYRILAEGIAEQLRDHGLLTDSY